MYKQEKCVRFIALLESLLTWASRLGYKDTNVLVCSSPMLQQNCAFALLPGPEHTQAAEKS
jgi:hypothetical protein